MAKVRIYPNLKVGSEKEIERFRFKKKLDKKRGGGIPCRRKCEKLR